MSDTSLDTTNCSQPLKDRNVLQNPGLEKMDGSGAVFPGTTPDEEVKTALEAGVAPPSNLDLSPTADDLPRPEENMGSGDSQENTTSSEGGLSPLPPKDSSAGSTGDVVSPTSKVDPSFSVKTGKGEILSLPDLIRLPNFTIGKTTACEWQISQGIDFGFKKIERDDVIVEKNESVLVFKPQVAGEIEIYLPYNKGKTVKFCVTVNPDPWSLWTIAKMDEKSIVFDSDKVRLDQEHKNVIAKSYQGLKIIGASRRGRSHERSGTFRDDDLGVWTDEENGSLVFLVSDGAGSCKFSREGALQAIKFIKGKLEENKGTLESAWKASESNLKPDCNVGMLLALLASKAKEYLVSLAEATKADGHDCRVKDFSGTLLMAALKLDANGGSRLVTFAIGDGAIAWRAGMDGFGLMCHPESGEFGGGTRFLVTPDVWKAIFYPSEDIPWTWNSFCESRVLCQQFSPEETKHLQIFLMSDGVSDPWFETDAGLENADKWHRFATEILTGNGENKAGLNLKDSPVVNAEKLWDWLYFKIVGNHDDRTMIMAYTADESEKEDANV